MSNGEGVVSAKREAQAQILARSWEGLGTRLVMLQTIASFPGLLEESGNEAGEKKEK